MNEEKDKSSKKKYTFNVNIVVEGYNKGMAIEMLTKQLQMSGLKQFQINSGELEENNVSDDSIKSKKKETAKVQQNVKQEEAMIIQQIENFRKNNTLIRLDVLKGKGVKISIPCRIVNFDKQSQNVIVYHVDEKKVYQYNLTEIEELIVT